ncbi:MAG TPA: M48 family metalloprotease [Candidatus Dormibacteraeota bacterium]|jgi:WD40 repeat protein|nr:M48 family metalloprotease [Candidatus Dormibacteraeota bacterium]
MAFRSRFFSTVVGALLFLIHTPAFGQQQGCSAPTLPARDRDADFFSAQQEMDVGDAVAEQVQREFHVIEDERITEYLKRIGDRLARQLPDSNLKFKYFVFDQPVSNAFGLPGGRIYVSRKLIGYVKNEDELAGVLSHELGHLVERQQAGSMARIFRDVLGVTQPGNREEIFKKYVELADIAAKKKNVLRASEKQEQQEQLIADEVALRAIVRAGYSPQAFVDFWDRFADTKGKTGSWLSDFFGTTSPESKRLREMQKKLATLPAACIEQHPVAEPSEFTEWQSAVLDYNGLGHKEKLHNVLSRKTLDPPLRDEIRNIRFSPDGKYLLTQDESTIFVLQREPLGFLFRIPAPQAKPAQFSPDSQRVVFYTPGLRVESWNIEDERKTFVKELVLSKGCRQTALSPDGNTLACYGMEFDLSLYDVQTSARVFQKKDFHLPQFGEYLAILISAIIHQDIPEFLNMQFSTDSRYFVAASHTDNLIAYDLQTKSTVSTPGSTHRYFANGFVFLKPDLIAAVDTEKPANSPVFKFPSGEVTERMPLGATLRAAANPRYVIAGPLKNYALGVADTEQKNLVLATQMKALDVYGDTFAVELSNGRIGIHKFPNALTKAITLPKSSINGLRASAVSPDVQWLAFSMSYRGGVWNLEQNKQVFHVRGYRGVYFGDDQAAYADFPKLEKYDKDPVIGRMNLANGSSSEAMKIEEEGTRMVGSILLKINYDKKSQFGKDQTWEAIDPKNGGSLWKRAFPKNVPTLLSDSKSQLMLVYWPANSEGAKVEWKSDPAMQQKYQAAGAGNDDIFVEAINPITGKTTGSFFAVTGKQSFRLERGTAAGNYAAVTDDANRILVYALDSGVQTGKLFGRAPSISPDSELLCAGNESGQLTLYDLTTMTKRDEFVFASPVAMTVFVKEGKQLFVLTEDQNVFLLDSSKGPAPVTATATAN